MQVTKLHEMALLRFGLGFDQGFDEIKKGLKGPFNFVYGYLGHKLKRTFRKYFNPKLQELAVF